MKMMTLGSPGFHLIVIVLLCESRELRGTESTRLPCVTPVVKSSSSRVTFRILSKVNNEASLQKQSTEHVDFLQKKGSAKKLFRRPPARFQIWIALEVLLILEDGRLQVHWIGRRRPVYKEVVEVLSDCKISSFWWFGNPAYGDSTGSNWIKKDKTVYLPDLFVRMVEKRQWDLVCGAPLDDWANAGLFWCPMHVHVVSAVLTFCVVGLILRNGCEFGDKRYVSLLQESEMSAG